ncbi:MAG: fumarylacetoacetate hydrolase family protein [Stackebrandtia sp.]
MDPELRIGPPMGGPGKVVCIGLNYTDHAEEIQAEPVIFLTDPGTVIGPDDRVLVPRNSSKTDREVEPGVVIGRRARYVTDHAEAMACVAGYERRVRARPATTSYAAVGERRGAAARRHREHDRRPPAEGSWAGLMSSSITGCARSTSASRPPGTRTTPPPTW